VTVVVILVVAALSLSCGNSTTTKPTAPNHLAYVTLPGQGSVLLMQIDGATGAIHAGGKTPPVQNASFNGRP